MPLNLCRKDKSSRRLLWEPAQALYTYDSYDEAVYIYSEFGDQLLVNYKTEVTVGNNYKYYYALINKDDYLASVNNYKEISMAELNYDSTRK